VSGRIGLPRLVVAGLRAWTRHHDRHVAAAVALLIGHEHWLRNETFRRACVHVDRAGPGRGGGRAEQVWVDRRAAREAFDVGEFADACSTGRGVLELAIALGADRDRLAAMGPANRYLVAVAVAAAVGTTGATVETPRGAR
jgi:hypothetical protein